MEEKKEDDMFRNWREVDTCAQMEGFPRGGRETDGEEGFSEFHHLVHWSRQQTSCLVFSFS